MKNIIKLSLLSLVIALVGCDKLGSPDHEEEAIERKDISLSTKQQSFLESGKAFGIELFMRSVKDCLDSEDPANMAVSPLSVELSLSMLSNGVEPETAAEIKSVLGFPEAELSEMNTYYNSLMSQLTELDNTTSILTSNFAFSNKQNGYLFPEAFQPAVKQYYNAEVRDDIDWKTDPVSGCKKINDIVSDNTDGKIKDLVKLKPHFDLINYFLINTLVFNGMWKNKFDSDNTSTGTFHGYLQESQSALMSMEENLQYSANELYKTLRIPYGNEAFSMYILLPNEGKKINDLLKDINLKSWELNKQSMTEGKVKVKLPKFEYSWYGTGLTDILLDMGIKRLFTEEKTMPANDICQGTHISVDENGTKAQAATAAYSGYTANLSFFICDRPFLYLIEEQSTGAILFAGMFLSDKD